MSSISPKSSTQSSSPPAPVVQSSTSQQSPVDDTIDLRVYMRVLLDWWKEIVLIALLCGLIGGLGYWLVLLSGDDVYSASADAAIVRTITEVTLDERFVTTAENPAATAVAARRNALIALAESPALAEKVIEELGDFLPEELRTPSALAMTVDAEMATATGRSGDSDLIRITSTTTNPEVSARIATAWAQAFVRNVNQVYGQVPDELFESIAVEQETSRVSYETAQEAYEEFLARSRVDEFGRIIADREATINTLRRGRINLLNGLIDSAVDSRNDVAKAVSDAQAQNLSAPITAEQAGKRELVQSYVNTIYEGQAQVVQQQGERDQQLLQNYYTRWLQVSRALDQAVALRNQTEGIAAVSGDEQLSSGSSSLALSLLKLQAFTGALDTPVTQDLAVDTPSEVVMNSSSPEAQAAAAPGLVQASQPVQVQIGATPLQIQLTDVATMTNAQIVAELESMVETLTLRRDELQTTIDELTVSILEGSSFRIPTVSPSENELARTLPSIVGSILGSSIITTTASALGAASSWDVGELAQLYNTSDLQALALAQSTGVDALLETIEAAEAELRILKAQLEAERTTQLELTLARDLAQDAFRAANSKKTELILARAGAGGELRFAAPAIAPNRPNGGISPILLAVASTMAGGLLGIIYAFVADAMGQEPFLSRRRNPRKPNLAAA